MKSELIEFKAAIIVRPQREEEWLFRFCFSLEDRLWLANCLCTDKPLHPVFVRNTNVSYNETFTQEIHSGL